MTTVTMDRCLSVDDETNELLKKIISESNDDNDEIISKYLLELENVTKLVLKNLGLSNGFGCYLEKILDKHQNLTLLDLSDNKLSNPSMHYLAKSIQTHPSIKKLVLHNNRITSAGICYLASGFAKNQSLEYVDLSSNEISSDVLEDLLTSLKNITGLNITDVNLPLNCANGFMVPFLNWSKLQKLCIGYNNLNNRGDISNLLKCVAENNISEFFLTDCTIDTTSESYLIDVINNNTKLETLSLSGTTFTIKTVNVLNALENNTSIKKFVMDKIKLDQYTVNSIETLIKNNTTLESLHVFGECSMNLNFSDVCQALATNTSLKHFGVNNVYYSQEIIDQLALVLEKNNTLESLCLHHNYRNNGSHNWANFYESLENNYTIIRLVIDPRQNVNKYLERNIANNKNKRFAKTKAILS